MRLLLLALLSAWRQRRDYLYSVKVRAVKTWVGIDHVEDDVDRAGCS